MPKDISWLWKAEAFSAESEGKSSHVVSMLHIHTGPEHVQLAGLLPLGACGLV